MKNVNMINPKIKNLLSNSWKLYSDNIAYIISIYLLVTIIGGLCNYIINQSESMDSIQKLIFYFSSELFLIGLSLGLLKILLFLNKNKPTTISTLFTSFDLIFKSFNGSILFSFAIFIVMLPGLIIILMSCNIDSLFISIWKLIDLKSLMPTINFNREAFNIDIYNQPLFALGILVSIVNIIWTAIRLQFYQYFIVDEECGAIQSLKRSFNITENQTNLLVQFLFTILIINLLGLLFFGIGIVFTIPFSLLLMSKLYLSLKRGSL